MSVFKRFLACRAKNYNFVAAFPVLNLALKPRMHCLIGTGKLSEFDNVLIFAIENDQEVPHNRQPIVIIGDSDFRRCP